MKKESRHVRGNIKLLGYLKKAYNIVLIIRKLMMRGEKNDF